MNIKFSLVAAAAGVALMGAGCAGTSSPATDDAGQNGAAMEDSMAQGNVLDGVWEITEATGEFASSNVGTKYTFDKAAGTLSTKNGIFVTDGVITEESDTSFTVEFEGVSTPFVYNYSFEGDKLMLELTSSGGQKFTLERK